ncbi:MAG: hypothetical protein EBX40_00840 [Gammaproteobacteria bacterium]|nr:hypothetical protein [Gammaproteobacteria bacterium]
MTRCWQVVFAFALAGIAFQANASCAGQSQVTIDLAVANYTGYPLTVDMSQAAPDYHGSASYAINNFDVNGAAPGNLVWQPKAITIEACFEPTGAPVKGGGTITFRFKSADVGLTKPGQPPVLGEVDIPLKYQAAWYANYKGIYPVFDSFSLPNRIDEEVPGASPLSGLALYILADHSAEAQINVVFYDLANAANVNVLTPGKVTVLPPQG